MWDNPNWFDKNTIKDINKKLSELKGELPEEKARETLGEFLRYNIAFTVEILTGIRLYPEQVIYIRSWLENNFNMCIAGRGCAKTLTYSHNSQVFSKQHGLITLKELLPDLSFDKEGWKNIPSTDLWNGAEWQKTDKIYIQPQKDCLRITTSDGYFLEGSVNHLIKVLNTNTLKIEWKRYNEIRGGEYACISRQNIPEIITPDNENLNEAYFIGLLLGDGSYRDTGARITTKDSQIIDWCMDNTSVINCFTKSETEAIDLAYGDAFISPLLEKYEMSKSLSYDKFIPQKIRNSKETLKLCLRGLFDTDGTVDKRGIVGFCSTSKRLAEQVHLSLLSFGIISHLFEQKTKSRFGKCWKIQISSQNLQKFSDEIGFSLSRKQARVEAALGIKRNANKDIIPGAKTFGDNLFRENYKHLSVEAKKEWHDKLRASDQLEISYQMNEKRLKFFDENDIRAQSLKDVSSEYFYFDKIVSIDNFKYDCIDFNVPNGSMYWSNGFISHNSTLAGIFAVLYCIFNPGVSVLIVSQNFRSSRRILENIERIALSPAGKLLRDVFKKDKLSRRGDLFQWDFINESRIMCVPLSNGDGLRGLRANVLIVDEALLVPMKIIEEILQPFLIASGNIKDKQIVREYEDKLIAMGEMKEEDRRVFKSTSKMILLSSASYQWEDLYKLYLKYLDKAKQDTEEERKIASYSVLHFSYESVPDDMLDSAMKEDIKNAPQSTIDREYKARFIENTRSYFSAIKMAECTVKDGEAPMLELVGDPSAKYVLGIDPSFSSSDASDHFAMCLMKVVKRNDKQIGMVVNQYAVAGGNLRDHILYLYYLMSNFNIVYIGIDASQGDNNEFINACNNSSIFKKAKLELKDIVADFHRDDMSILPQQILMSYNGSNGRIVQKQGFHSGFQRAANEYLVTCIESKNIIFAGRMTAVTGATDNLANMAKDLPMLFHPTEGHAEFNDDVEGGIFVFLDDQERLMKLVKNECSLIEISTTPLGTVSYDLPPNLKRSKSPNRDRKDSYSALLLANWCLKLYIQAMETPKQDINTTFKPFII